MDTDYHSECGRDAPSTVESLGCNNDKVHEWIKQVHMPTIDEDGDSVISEDLSTEEMLNRLYNNKPNENKESLPDSGVSTVNSNDFSLKQNSSTYVTEATVDELLHGTFDEGQVLLETRSRDQVDPHTNPNHLQGQYIEHDAVADTVDDGGPSPQPTTSVPSARILPNDACITSGIDGGCGVGCDSSEPVPSTASSHSFDGSGHHDTSNHCSTPTTGVYQSYIDNSDNLQPLPSDSDVTLPVVPVNALGSVGTTHNTCDPFAYVHLPDDETASLPFREVSAANPNVSGITQTVAHGDYVSHDIASSDVNASHLPPTNTAVPGEYMSHSAIGDVFSTNGLPPASQNNPFSQENTQPLNHSHSELKPNSVSIASSIPYTTLDEDSNSLPSPMANNTQASGEYLPYNAAVNCDEKINDCGQTNGYLPYSGNDKIVLPTFDALAKENDIEFLSNGYVTTSM